MVLGVALQLVVSLFRAFLVWTDDFNFFKALSAKLCAVKRGSLILAFAVETADVFPLLSAAIQSGFDRFMTETFNGKLNKTTLHVEETTDLSGITPCRVRFQV
jgi:hypothetical protein